MNRGKRGLDKCWYCRRSLDEITGQGMHIYRIRNKVPGLYRYLTMGEDGTQRAYVCPDCHNEIQKEKMS